MILIAGKVFQYDGCREGYSRNIVVLRRSKFILVQAWFYDKPVRL
jgi:hypothetical protein